MSEYRLVQVAWPLASKVDAGMGWTINYRFLEQVEKVASQRTDFTISMEAAEQVLIAAAELLCAPHPAVQQPDDTQPVSVPEIIKTVADFVGSQKGGPFTTAVIKAAILGQLEYGDAFTKLLTPPTPAQQSTEQQPDVAMLVEALEAVMEFGCDPKSNRGMWALEKAESALAAYHNQGGAI